MHLTRRGALALGAAAATVAALPRTAFAATDTEAAIAAFTGGATVADTGVDITAPEIAENGNTVPVEVAAAGASSIIILAPGNPNPGVATFHFGPLAAESRVKTRMRMAKTQDLVVVAKMSDGSFAMAKRQVKVTIGGCGG
jgi:sulfur-oxidizing protein SoxY